MIVRTRLGVAGPLVIGLGGNVGGEAAVTERFRRAREALSALGAARSAPLYRTAPIGPEQSPFLNTAVALAAPNVHGLRPDELLAMVRGIEHLLGRDRRGVERWGPRSIDLDVLVWGGHTVRLPDLEVPHPRLAERRFALQPLAALVGEGFEIVGVGPLGPLLERVREQSVEEIAATW